MNPVLKNPISHRLPQYGRFEAPDRRGQIPYQGAASGVAVSAERAGQPLLRLLATGSPTEAARPPAAKLAETEPVAEVLGVNLYAKQLVDDRDRKKLEQLCRYVMRPPLSQERLEWRSDGRVELTLKNVWKDGTRALVLEPFDLLVRLCAAIPPPWFNMVRYFGVLASHSRHRARVVPSRTDPSRFAPPPAAGDQLAFASTDGAATVPTAPSTGRSRWISSTEDGLVMATRLSLGGALLGITAAGCSTHYQPRSASRISIVMEGGGYAYYKNGETIESGFFGGGLVEAVEDDPQALEAAETFHGRMTGGFIANVAGIGCLVGGAAYAFGGEHESDGSLTDIQATVFLSALGCYLAGAITGTVLVVSGLPYQFDAINIYNDNFEARYRAAPPITAPLPVMPPPAPAQ